MAIRLVRGVCSASWVKASVLAVSGVLAACAAERGVSTPEPPPRATPATGDRAGLGPVERELYPAELVMDHQAELGLDAAQIAAMQSELDQAQRDLGRNEWELRAAKEALVRTLAAPRVDEAAATAATERVTRVEGTIKVAHLRLLVRIKNLLTADQQRRLDALRARPTAR